MNSDIQIIVISCNEERQVNMKKQFTDLNIQFPIKYLEGNTPENSKDFVPNNVVDWYKRMICCTKSHINAIIEAAKDDAPTYTIILEDDASIHTTDFLPVINKLISIWDTDIISPMISLGWCPKEVYPAHDNITNCFDIDSTYK